MPLRFGYRQAIENLTVPRRGGSTNNNRAAAIAARLPLTANLKSRPKKSGGNRLSFHGPPFEAAARNRCSEAEFDHGGHTAFGGAIKHLIVGVSDSSWVIQIWYLPSGENGKARSHATKNGS